MLYFYVVTCANDVEPFSELSEFVISVVNLLGLSSSKVWNKIGR
jgi:hypothetical protein